MRQEQEAAGNPVRVLLVEEEPRASPLVAEMLRAIWTEGLIVSQTASLADATRELLDHGATCVVLDSGALVAPVDAVEQLAAGAPDVPIIVLADATDAEFDGALVRAGAQDVLPRGELTPSSLSRSIRHAIDRKRAEGVLAHQALHDPLTSLPNRTLLLDRLRVALGRSRRTGGAVVVMFLDVDGFKQINDSLGHTAGDHVLTVLADRFRRLLRPMDTVARLGGDEFVFLVEGLASEPEAALLAERISAAARRPLVVAGDTISISVSIGITVVADPATVLEVAVGRADRAMYRAKALGGGRCELSGPLSIPEACPDGDLEPALREALSRWTRSSAGE